MVRKVLIVDDDQEMLDALKEGLEKYHETFVVETALDGQAAIEELKKQNISLVVTDLKMPRMDGFTLLAFIMENYPDIPVIIITGYSTPEMEKLAREGGAVGYIAKPFMIEKLAKQVMTTLRKESDGGTLHSVSSGVFLQLMEMEQKTCTIRLEDKPTGRKGVLFFREGELLDARVNHLQGEAAALEIFSWDQVTLSIQNICSVSENKINSELQPLILEAMRLKDEREEGAKTEVSDELVPEVEEVEEEVAPDDLQGTIKTRLEQEVGPRCGVEDIYLNSNWDGFIEQLNRVGAFFKAGRLKAGYIDNGQPNDYILVPGEQTTVIEVNTKCPRDKIMHTLNR
jgi:DNA-binding response OmpR family regulator